MLGGEKNNKKGVHIQLSIEPGSEILLQEWEDIIGHLENWVEMMLTEPKRDREWREM